MEPSEGRAFSVFRSERGGIDALLSSRLESGACGTSIDIWDFRRCMVDVENRIEFVVVERVTLRSLT